MPIWVTLAHAQRQGRAFNSSAPLSAPKIQLNNEAKLRS